MQETWGRGLVHFQDPKTLRQGELRERARRLSGYLAKYVSKELGAEQELNKHRYEVAQGFGVEIARRSFQRLSEANDWLLNFKGERFSQVWSYAEDVDWDGPPVWVFRSPGLYEGT